MSKKIWLIDDNDIERFIARKMLELCDVTIDISEFSNGFEALKQLRKNTPDIILLDISMPKMDGWEFIDALEGIMFEKEKFIYMLSSSDNYEDMKKSENNKYIAKYFVKPFNESYLEYVC
jgi:CheY-like chemotaxis protein